MHSLAVRGNTLYSAWADNTMRAWDIESGDCTRTIPAAGPLLASAEGCVFVGNTPNADAVKVWTARGGPYAVMRGHQGTVNAVFATEEVLYSAGADGIANAYIIPPVPVQGYYEKKGGGCGGRPV